MARMQKTQVVKAPDARRLRASAARGARALDRVRPGWWRRVKIGELQMQAASRCVVGQTAGVRELPCVLYTDDVLLRDMVRAAGLGRIGNESTAFGPGRQKVAQVGYMPPEAMYHTYRSYDILYAVLQAQWLEEIRTRRRAYRARLATRSPHTRRPVRR